MQPYSIFSPVERKYAILFNSPHSGTYVSDRFLKLISIDPALLHYSGDIFVDQLIRNVPCHGSTSFINHYARIYVDTSRAADEIDPHMFQNSEQLNFSRKSEKVSRGFGVISRKSFDSQELYSRKLPVSEIDHRLNKVYFPIHKALNKRLSQFIQEQGYYLLLDCHSMPSYGFINPDSYQVKQPDLIIGDCHGSSCREKISQFVADYFIQAGMDVSFNIPYAGGYNTHHYGDPASNRHALQLEFNRTLYMDEKLLEKNSGFTILQQLLTELSRTLTDNLDHLIGKKPSCDSTQ